MDTPIFEQSELRRVLGSFCSGVTVVTTMTPDGPAGFTCQSFSSLSLDPPLVLISPAKSSKTWPVIREASTFAINILAEDHDGFSGQFARSGTDKFAGVSWTEGPQGSPILPGVVAWAECELWAEYEGGDHTIVAARVLALGDEADTRPLLFFRSRYHVTSPHVGAV